MSVTKTVSKFVENGMGLIGVVGIVLNVAPFVQTVCLTASESVVSYAMSKSIAMQRTELVQSFFEFLLRVHIAHVQSQSYPFTCMWWQ